MSDQTIPEPLNNEMSKEVPGKFPKEKDEPEKKTPEINFDISLKDFTGKEITKANIKEMMLQAIGSSKAKDGASSIKQYNLGVKIANNSSLKSEDIVLLRTVIGDSELFTVLAKGQILKMIEDK